LTVLRHLPLLSVSNEANVSHISRDQNVVDTYITDTLMHGRISVGLGIEQCWIKENVLCSKPRH